MLEEQFAKVWVVHRIDKSTSGIIIFALTAEAHRSLNIQFEKHRVEKKYHAILNGSPNWSEKITKFPLRANVGNKHRTIVDNRNGVRAETRFRILKQNQLSALAEAMPMTGRTHQIRVHAFALGYPLLGDILYSAPETEIIARAALHAHSLSFDHPATNERVTFTAPYPADFEKALERLKLY
jgi:RluA family pseudouridine synthase